jgi:membrane-associated phospholipid phosphatase
MDTIWQWGLDLIRTIQLVHGPALDAFFKAVTFTCEEEFLIISLSLVFWCMDCAMGVRLAFAYCLSSGLNYWLKDLIAHPRPYDFDPSLKLFDTEGYGLPSNHSQEALLLWGIVAAKFRRTWVWVVSILMIVLVGFSRVYLGLHFPTDVVAGWAIGAILLVTYLRWGARIEAWLDQAGLKVQLALAVVVPLVILLPHPNPTSGLATVTAVLMGMGVGLALGRQVAPFSPAGPLWRRGVRFLVGAVGLLAIYLGLKFVFPDEGESLYFAMRFIRYALVGLWAMLGAPWLFLRLGLASRE